jgi:hypothetical protein
MGPMSAAISIWSRERVQLAFGLTLEKHLDVL